MGTELHSAPLPGAPAALPGDRLGPFEVTGLLGEGGNGVVYAARRGDRELAVKVPRPELELTPREHERFVEEARMMARVKHPAVIEVLDAGTLPDGRPYLAMTLLRGETLAARIARAGALPVGETLRLFAELAEATATLHDAGLIHRDLKPENVFLVDGGLSPGAGLRSAGPDGSTSLKLLDFGIAKERSAGPSTTTQAGLARGTPATMAPERFFGSPATESSDVYELAVVLYMMLVGRLPWKDGTDVEVRLHPESPIEAGLAIPRGLSAELMRALSTRPERRPLSARAFAERVHAEGAGGAKPDRVTQASSTFPPPPGEPAEDAVVEPALAPTVAVRVTGETSGQTHVKDAITQPREVARRSPLLVLAGVAALGAAIGLAFVKRGSDAVPPSEPAAAPERAVVDTAAAAPRPPEPPPTAAAPPDPPRAQPTASVGRPGKATPKTSPSGSPTAATAAPAPSELPGGVYEKPPY